MGPLADAGFRVVAPFLRGYPPSEVPESPPDTETLAEDVRNLIDAFAQDAAHVIGHDWGGVAAFNASALFQDRILSAVSIGVGHPATGIEIFNSPDRMHYSFHLWLFQLEGLGELALQANDFEMIDYLWRHWSHQTVDQDHIDRAKEAFRQPGVPKAALGYYRGVVRAAVAKPEFFERVTRPTRVPMMVVYGAEDPARAISQGEDKFFEGQYRRELVEGAGHFVHRERPEETTRLLLQWLESHSGFRY